MSLRIAVVVPSLSGGGAEFVARTWAEWLRTQGHAVAMILTNGSDSTRPPPVDVAVTGLDPSAGVAGKVRQLRRFVAGWRPDVILSLQAYPNLLYYQKHPEGAHFAAWEQPKALVDDLRNGFRSLR